MDVRLSSFNIQVTQHSRGTWACCGQQSWYDTARGCSSLA